MLVVNHDSGEKSPFIINRVQIYILKPGSNEFELISEGVCHYNP